MKKFFSIILILCMCLSAAGCALLPGNGVSVEVEPEKELATPTPEPTAAPTPEPTPEPEARELTDEVTAWDNMGGDTSRLLDRNISTGINYTDGAVLTVSCDTPMAGVYVIWEQPPANYYVTAGDTMQLGGQFGCLQEYIAFDSPQNEFNLETTGFSMLRYLRVFGEGRLPSDVHQWKAPWEQADVCVFPTHADDDVIFFGALIADCVNRGLAVQVCYMVQHYSQQPRPQEMLNALWELGIDHYPVNGGFLDYYVTSLSEAKGSFNEENVTGYVVECLRRFKPSVAVGHDTEGEYGHGAHQLFSESLQIACQLSGDGQYYYRSYNSYGAWDVPKVYLHMYQPGRVMLEVETPLEQFGGRTAFETAQDAMEYHVSQLVYPHRPQLDSEDFPRYDCRKFGLYRSLVGEDTGNDIMEHATPVERQQ